MGLTSLRSFLRRHPRLGLDTSLFIYHLEAHPRYQALAAAVFAWLEGPGHSAVTSTITMTELLVQPYRQKDQELIDLYFGLLSTYPNLEWIAPDLHIADVAACLRAEHRLRTPDSLQAATALRSRATGLLTNDPALRRVKTLEVGILDDFLN